MMIILFPKRDYNTRPLLTAAAAEAAAPAQCTRAARTRPPARPTSATGLISHSRRYGPTMQVR